MSVGQHDGPPAASAATASSTRVPSPLDDAVAPGQVRRAGRRRAKPSVREQRRDRLGVAVADLEHEPAARLEHAAAPRATTASVAPRPTSASRGSQSRTSGSSVSISSGSTYGGFETTRSYGPPAGPRGGRARRSVDASASPVRSAFSAASASASARDVDRGHARARMLVRDRERDRARAGADVEHVGRARRPRAARGSARPRSRSRAAARAPGVGPRASSRRKPHSPST